MSLELFFLANPHDLSVIAYFNKHYIEIRVYNGGGTDKWVVHNDNEDDIQAIRDDFKQLDITW